MPAYRIVEAIDQRTDGVGCVCVCVGGGGGMGNRECVNIQTDLGISSFAYP